MPLVLVSNDVNATDRYDWNDVTGVQYHYPNEIQKIKDPASFIDNGIIFVEPTMWRLVHCK
jgi:hypothetical protein